MPWVVAAGAAAGAIGSAVIGSKASSKASDAQIQSTQAGIAEQKRQFDAVRSLLDPYIKAATGSGPNVGITGGGGWFGGGFAPTGADSPGTRGSLAAQQDLLGLNGADAQSTAISGIQNSPMFTGLVQQGENSILQNASATGGLRGSNVQGALSQFRPSMLSALIDQQYSRLAGITSLGQNAAAGVGNAGMQTGNAVTSLLQQQGAAQAGGILANGQIIGSTVGNLGGLGAYYGLQGQANYSPSYSPAVYGDGGLYASGGANSGQF